MTRRGDRERLRRESIDVLAVDGEPMKAMDEETRREALDVLQGRLEGDAAGAMYPTPDGLSPEPDPEERLHQLARLKRPGEHMAMMMRRR